MMVDGFQLYWNFSKLVQGERFRENDWIAINYLLKNSNNSSKTLGLAMGYILSTRGYTIL